MTYNCSINMQNSLCFRIQLRWVHLFCFSKLPTVTLLIVFAVRMHHTIHSKQFNAQGFHAVWRVRCTIVFGAWGLVFDMSVNTGIYKINQIHSAITSVCHSWVSSFGDQIWRFGQMLAIIFTQRTETNLQLITMITIEMRHLCG